MKQKNKKRLGNPYKKGNAYAAQKGQQLLRGILTLMAVVLAIAFVQEMGSELLFSAFGLTSIAAIIPIADVSDRETSGNEIGYEVFLLLRSQVDNTVAFPKPNANRQVSTIPLKSGEYFAKFEAHTIPTFMSNGEKGDVTTTGTNTLTMIMGGMRAALLNFIEQHAGDKFVVVFKEKSSGAYYIVGSYDDPMVLGSYEAKNDADGRYVTFTFTRNSIYQYYNYTGSITQQEATNLVAAATTLALGSASEYNVPDGSAATYAIAAISGLSANDKGRHITLYGKGTTKSATIADGSAFVLEDGATWTAKAGSRITFLVMDASTLVEVQGSRVQTV